MSKKIFFSDKYGLTQAVLDGRKTMTRRIVPQSVVDYYAQEEDPTIIDAARYNIGEVVAIAQAYKELDYSHNGFAFNPSHTCAIGRSFAKTLIGWENKLFVRANEMPHHIRITDIKVERLQEISIYDCFKEGITTITEGKQEVGNAFGWDVKIDAVKRESFFTPRAAFAALIDKISGKGTWEKNPWVFAYEFELID